MAEGAQRALDSRSADWRLLVCAADRHAAPADLPPLDDPAWMPATVPGTLGLTLDEQGEWRWDCPRDLDEPDVWYACEFEADPAEAWDRLHCEGLATLCEIWLNDRCLGQTDNMFRPWVFALEQQLQPRNRLLLRFRSLKRALAEKRPRPAWKTRLVSHQNLRWMRSTLLGRIPGWSPPMAPVGPWRVLTLRAPIYPRDLQLTPRLHQGAASVTIRFTLPAGFESVRARLVIDGQGHDLEPRRDGGCWRVDERIPLSGIEPWMPHTHGISRLYEARVELAADGQEQPIPLPSLGFRELELMRDDGDFSLSVNGVPLFCRGACWTVNDIRSLDGDGERLRDTLELMRRAGANMIRIGGTMVYEQEVFYALCDELGILVWQDFMFANMDYPFDDPAFREQVTAEAEAQLRRLSAHACIAVYCGNSEVEQQATMMGLPPAEARNPLFHELLPGRVAELHPGVPYVPSTPSSEDEEDLPFRNDRGLSHFYGIGAYLRSFSELRRQRVRFTPEALGFAHVPSLEMRKALFANETAIMHHPLWKQRTPRDANAGWDFEDVRDHYLQQLLSLDGRRLRHEQPEFYWRVSAFVGGEALRRAYAEWRSGHSVCRGALVWFLKDLWPGAGWGIIDSEGEPKSAWYALARIWQPRGVCFTDEGLDGLDIHVFNEADTALTGELCLRAFNAQGRDLVRVTERIELPPRGRLSLKATRLLGRFFDFTHAYRFGPLAHQGVSVELVADDGQVDRDLYLPEACLPRQVDASAISAEALPGEGGQVLLRLRAERLIHGLHVEARGYRCSDNDFHLAPGQSAEIRLQPRGQAPSRFSATVEALNLDESIRLRLKS